MEHDGEFDTHKITDTIEANLGLVVEFLNSKFTSETLSFDIILLTNLTI